MSRDSRARQTADEDAAAALVVLALLAGGDGATSTESRSVWGDPAHRLRITAAGPAGWWRSGLPS